MTIHIILMTSCILLLLLEGIVLQHASLLNMYRTAEIPEKNELTAGDIADAWGFKPQPSALETVITAPAVETAENIVAEYQESTLSEEQQDFFKKISMWDAIEEKDTVFVEAEVEPYIPEEAPAANAAELEQLFAEPQMVEEVTPVKETRTLEDQFISMSDWEEKPVPEMNIGLSSTATHKIKDQFIGEQLWIVEIIGYEQDYIHVSDGDSRAWLKVRNSKGLSKNDILSVLVERDLEDQLHVIDLDILQKHSQEFALEIEQEEEELEMIYDYVV